MQKTNLAPSPELNAFLEQHGTSGITTGCKVADLIRRPQLGYDCIAPFDTARPALDPVIGEQVEIQIKYDGYIPKQLEQIERMRKLENKQLPEDLDYTTIRGLRLEAPKNSTPTVPRIWDRRVVSPAYLRQIFPCWSCGKHPGRVTHDDI